jgi:sugar phosphate isomerase/epimerase
MWKLCLGQNGFISKRLYGYDFSPEDILDHAAEMGYDGVELHHALDPYPEPTDDVAIRKHAEKATSRGLAVVGIQARVAQGQIFSDNPRERAAWTRAAIAQVDLCHKLGGVQCGFWPAGRQPDLPDDVIVSRLSDALKPVAEQAEKLRIMTTVEPEPVQIDYSYEIAEQIVDAVDSDYFRIILDCSHAEVMTGSAIEAVKKYAGKIGHIHFCDSDGTTLIREGGSQSSKHLAAGDGHLDLPAILRALKETGYDRWLQIDVWENPDPIRCSRVTKQFVDSVLAK